MFFYRYHVIIVLFSVSHLLTKLESPESLKTNLISKNVFKNCNKSKCNLSCFLKK